MVSGQEPSKYQAWVEPGGRIILNEAVMADVVMETAGGALWVNEKVSALGIRLLRDEEDPPYPIERQSAPGGGTVGVLEAGAFLEKKGLTVGPAALETACQYYAQYQVIEIRLGRAEDRPDTRAKGFWDDYPALED